MMEVVGVILIGVVTAGVVAFLGQRIEIIRRFFSRFERTPSGGILKRRFSGGRHSVQLVLELDDHLLDLPLLFRVLIVRAGDDSQPLLNEFQEFDRIRNQLVTTLSYPTQHGLQFKCFVDWVEDPPSLTRARNLLTQNGWIEISEDGQHKGRFWFIVPYHATKRTEGITSYVNNWLPAGPPIGAASNVTKSK